DCLVIKMRVLLMGASNLAEHLPQHLMRKVNDLILQECLLPQVLPMAGSLLRLQRYEEIHPLDGFCQEAIRLCTQLLGPSLTVHPSRRYAGTRANRLAPGSPCARRRWPGAVPSALLRGR